MFSFAGAFSLHKYPSIMSHLANHKILVELAYGFTNDSSCRLWQFLSSHSQQYGFVQAFGAGDGIDLESHHAAVGQLGAAQSVSVPRVYEPVVAVRGSVFCR